MITTTTLKENEKIVSRWIEVSRSNNNSKGKQIVDATDPISSSQQSSKMSPSPANKFAILQDIAESDEPFIEVIERNDLSPKTSNVDLEVSHPQASAPGKYHPLRSLQQYRFSLALSVQIEQAIARGSIGLYLRLELNISHLSFADDLVIFTDGEPSFAHGMHSLLCSFSQWSGLHLNPLKSQLFSSLDDSEFANILGIPLCHLPVKHLGLPLTQKSLTHSMCMPLIDKMRSKIHFWSSSLLSKAGRLELVHSVLQSFSYYWIAGFPPKKDQQGHRTTSQQLHVGWRLQQLKSVCGEMGAKDDAKNSPYVQRHTEEEAGDEQSNQLLLN
ncbi:hypothetical protein QJS10_CPB20g00336 [Acorus calamus]|uniref:Reverse transcriptase domain-containing protein n=1 Tax=Acorus calamus TaxID=4465 RepID=A0AAV9CCX3_ACOCL|nr:hypothetical protein QJS10_CPB20g00336 [Acorus calamus]